MYVTCTQDAWTEAHTLHRIHTGISAITPGRSSAVFPLKEYKVFKSICKKAMWSLHIHTTSRFFVVSCTLVTSQFMVYALARPCQTFGTHLDKISSSTERKFSSAPQSRSRFEVSFSPLKIRIKTNCVFAERATNSIFTWSFQSLLCHLRCSWREWSHAIQGTLRGSES